MFKVGDRVRVTDGEAADREYGAAVDTGDVGIIVEIMSGGECPIGVNMDNDPDGADVPWYMNEKHLKLEEDPVNSPSHYTWLPNGLEVIDITEHLGFCLGNSVKYILRADYKGKPVEDLQKARWYIDRELAKRERQ